MDGCTKFVRSLYQNLKKRLFSQTSDEESENSEGEGINKKQSQESHLFNNNRSKKRRIDSPQTSNFEQKFQYQQKLRTKVMNNSFANKFFSSSPKIEEEKEGENKPFDMKQQEKPQTQKQDSPISFISSPLSNDSFESYKEMDFMTPGLHAQRIRGSVKWQRFADVINNQNQKDSHRIQTSNLQNSHASKFQTYQRDSSVLSAASLSSKKYQISSPTLFAFNYEQNQKLKRSRSVSPKPSFLFEQAKKFEEEAKITLISEPIQAPKPKIHPNDEFSSSNLIDIHQEKQKEQSYAFMPSQTRSSRNIKHIFDKHLLEKKKQQQKIDSWAEILSNQLLNEVIEETCQNSLNTIALPEIILDSMISEVILEYMLKSRNFFALSQREREFVQDIYRRGKESDIVCNGFNVNITRKTLRCLEGLSWLNDEIINFHFKLLNERNQIDVASQKARISVSPLIPNFDKAKELSLHEKRSVWIPKCFFHNTFFITKISKNLTGAYDYDSVMRWTKNENLFEYDKILAPCHLGVHWTLSVINMKEKRFEYYDSMSGSTGHQIIKILKRYIEDEYKDKIVGRKWNDWKAQNKNSPIPKDKNEEEKMKNEVLGKLGVPLTFDTSKFSIYYPHGDQIPQQLNGSDCGVFCCTFAKFISQGSKPDLFLFSQQNMPYFRQRMLMDISNKRII